jgi:hypothetical protein
MFGKFDGKSVKRTFMQTRNKPLHHLAGKQLKGAELLQARSINWGHAVSIKGAFQ